MQGPSAFGSLDVHAPSPSPAETHPLSPEAVYQTADSHSRPPQSPPAYSQRERSERASSPGSLAGWHAFKPAPAGRDFKSAGSLPILQSALHRRSAFAQGIGILPPSLGVTPSYEGPFPPQALILKDNSHRREAYAKGQGALPPSFSSRQKQPSMARVDSSSESDSLHESASGAFVNLDEAPDLLTEVNDSSAPKNQLDRLLPSGRTMKQVESFNTDVVRQSIDRAQKAESNDKHISSAGELLSYCCHTLVVVRA